jgi:hypothetical protein
MVVAAATVMLRWRLRFNLQELDLRPGRIALGRAAECPISFEDPLVSRHHAEIVVSELGVRLIDLDSRNGVRVNGVRITEPTTLQANDRIRLGRDELVILCASDELFEETSRITGVEEGCERCGHEFASGSAECPRCHGTAPGVSKSGLRPAYQLVTERTSGAS